LPVDRRGRRRRREHENYDAEVACRWVVPYIAEVGVSGQQDEVFGLREPHDHFVFNGIESNVANVRCAVAILPDDAYE
jgi:hypothetical protein